MDTKEDVDLDELRKRMFLPPEALGMMGDAAQEAVTAWLKRENAPEAVIDTLNTTFYLGYLMLQDPDTFPFEGRKTWNEEVEVTISLLGWGIKALGGWFGDQPCVGSV